MDCGPAGKERPRPLQGWEPGACTRAGNARFRITTRNFACLAMAAVLRRENGATRPTLPRLVQSRVTMTTEGDEVLGTILP